MILSDISFIVIAKNEDFAIDECLSSIAKMDLFDCQVICVDSDSTDNTLDVMKSYSSRIENLKVVKCSGDVNAAVARNVGLKFADKKYIFFVDGDIELNPNFIYESIKCIQSGEADAVTGKLWEKQYSPDYTLVVKDWDRRSFMTVKKQLFMTGGIFITTKHIVDKIGRWDQSLVCNQDLDYTLRISRYGKLIQLPVFIGTHHTQAYVSRSWQHFKKGYGRFYGLLLRRNIDRPCALLRLLRGNRGLFSFLLLIFSIICLSLAKVYNMISSLQLNIMIILLFAIEFLYSVCKKKQNISSWLLETFLQPIIILSVLFNNSQNGNWKVEVEEIL